MIVRFAASKHVLPVETGARLVDELERREAEAMLLTDVRQRVCLSFAILFRRCVPVGHRGICRDERWEQREDRWHAESTPGRSERPERLGSSDGCVVWPHRQRGGHATSAASPLDRRVRVVAKTNARERWFRVNGVTARRRVGRQAAGPHTPARRLSVNSFILPRG